VQKIALRILKKMKTHPRQNDKLGLERNTCRRKMPMRGFDIVHGESYVTKPLIPDLRGQGNCLEGYELKHDSIYVTYIDGRADLSNNREVQVLDIPLCKLARMT